MTILNSYENIADFVALIIVCAIFGGLVAALIYMVISILCDFSYDSFVALWLSIVIGCLIGGFGSYIVVKEPDTRYEIVLNDNYPANEFLSKYEIIEQRGQIYLVEEKDD